LNAAAADDVAVAELEAILEDINAGQPRDPLIKRLLAVVLTGSKAEAGLLTRIGAVRGWRSIVAGLDRPAPGPKLRVVEEGEDVEQEAPEGMPEGWSDPRGWICSRRGVSRLCADPAGGQSWKQITPVPIWIAERWAEMPEYRQLHADGQRAVYVRLMWPGGSVVVPQEVALTANLLQGLSAQDVPVSSDSARRIVPWLEAALRHNAEILPARIMVRRLGWARVNGALSFQTPDGPYRLHVESGADEQLACAVRPAGTLEGWMAVAAVAHRTPLAAVMLAASVASALLELCCADPFIVDLHGTTSRGKTTHLRWAASAWGDSRQLKGGYLMSWTDTATSVERVASLLNSYPMMLDDTKQLPEERSGEVSQTVYSWGSGKGRGTVAGRQVTSGWRSVLFSTGEAPLAQIAKGKHAGMSVRVLPFPNRPYEGGRPDVELVKSQGNWGHIGPMVAAWGAERAGTLPEDHARIRTGWAKDLGESEQADRLASMLAAIQIGARALRELGVPMPGWEGAMKPILLDAATRALCAADIQTSALDLVRGWLASQPHRIHGAGTGSAPPSMGWIGRVMTGGGVGVLAPPLEGYLRDNGYNPADILPQWQEQGVAEAGKVTKLDGRCVRLIWLKVQDWTAHEPDAQIE